MSIDKISAVTQFQNSLMSSVGEQLKKTQGDNTNSTKKVENDQVHLQITVPQQTLDTLQKIGSISDVLNSTAKSLRATGKGLSASADLAEKMRDTLKKITKNYPPFSIDSAERRDILMSYRALQKEMEKMMVPAPPPPVYDKVQGLWKDLFGQNLPGNVALPDLQDNASDTTVVDATTQLEATGKAITAVQTAIGASL
jgi:hypothetical protein